MAEPENKTTQNADPAKQPLPAGRKAADSAGNEVSKVGGQNLTNSNNTADQASESGKKKDDSSLKIKIELDLDVQLELHARIKGDITIGLL